MAKKLANTQFNLTQNTIKYLSCLDLTPSTKLVCIYLTTCYNPKNKQVFPKQSTIAEKMGITERTVTRAIKELISKNFCIKNVELILLIVILLQTIFLMLFTL